MAKHLLKIAAGVTNFAELEQIILHRAVSDDAFGHITIIPTRNTPRETDTLLDGGSIYWIIKGKIAARAPLLDIRKQTDDEGRGYCELCISPEIIATVSQPKRGFQGWRYLADADAPADLDGATSGDGIGCAEIASELRELGLV